MPLQRIRPEDKSKEWRLGKSVRLYLDDVEDILAVMRQVDDEVRVYTSVLAGTLTNVDELKEQSPDNLAGLRFESGSAERGIAVQLDPPVTVRITPGDDIGLTGASQKIYELLAQRQIRAGAWRNRRSWRLSVRNVLIALSAAAFTVLAMGLSLTIVDWGWWYHVSWVKYGSILGGGAFAMMLAFVTSETPFASPRTAIIRDYRTDAPTWWERNHTTVLINLMTGSLFFVLGLWLG